MTVSDPYNLYFSPDGASAIIVAELYDRLDFHDPVTMALKSSIHVEGCDGINHGDYTANGHYFVVTCEYAGKVAKIDMKTDRVTELVTLDHGTSTAPMTMMPNGNMVESMPQDIRLGPDGRHFYVADMLQGGVHVLNADTLSETAFIPTGKGAHGITPSHDGTKLFIANRGSAQISGPAHGPGTVAVLDPSRGVVTATWTIPGGGSPDMGNLTADGSELWLSGRFDSEVYVLDATRGNLIARIRVPQGPHGLTVWPLSLIHI